MHTLSSSQRWRRQNRLQHRWSISLSSAPDSAQPDSPSCNYAQMGMDLEGRHLKPLDPSSSLSVSFQFSNSLLDGRNSCLMEQPLAPGKPETTHGSLLRPGEPATFLARLGDKVRLPEGGPHLLVKQQERNQSYFPTGHPDIRVSVLGTSSLPSASMETLRGLKGSSFLVKFYPGDTCPPPGFSEC